MKSISRSRVMLFAIALLPTIVMAQVGVDVEPPKAMEAEPQKEDAVLTMAEQMPEFLEALLP